MRILEEHGKRLQNVRASIAVDAALTWHANERRAGARLRLSRHVLYVEGIGHLGRYGVPGGLAKPPRVILNA